MARGMRTTNNSGGGGGSIDAHGVIICDTTTMSVGDVVRVRSVYNPLITEDKTVAIVGAPLYFNVNPYDYYKVCMVQTIDDTPTEIGGVYRTIDLGQTLFIDVIDKSSFGGAQGILNAHQQANIYQIGDIINTKVQGVVFPMLVAGINIDGANSVTLSAKYAWEQTIGRSAYANPTTYVDSAIRTKTQSFYDNMTEGDKQFVKEVTKSTVNGNGGAVTYSDKAWVMSQNDLQNVYPLYTTQASRVKKATENGNNVSWWTSSGTKTTANMGWMPVQADGSIAQSNWAYANTNYVVPCVVLQADI